MQEIIYNSFKTFVQVSMQDLKILKQLPESYRGKISPDILGKALKTADISEAEPFMNAYNQGQAWTGYLHTLQRRYGNRDTGALTPAKP